MPEIKIERCVQCDSPTGRAGKLEDSLYLEDTQEGPFCEDCYTEEILK